MSNELNSEINESIFNNKILNFYKKFKLYIILFLLLTLSIPIAYQVNIYFDKKKNSKSFEEYSVGLTELNKNNIKNATIIFEKLLYSNNDTIILLSLDQLYRLNKQDKLKIVKIIDNVLQKNTMKKSSEELLKLKKALIVFDEASEKEMLELLNIKNKTSFVSALSLEIMYNFYIKKNEINKANQIKSLLNEK